MGLTGWLLVVSLVLVLMCATMLFITGATAAPRGITSGPVVTFARLLFAVMCVGLAVAVVALVWGLVTSWA